MVLQNKHKQLASKRWNKARGNPIKRQEGRSGGNGRPGAVAGADEGSGSEDESGSGEGEADDDDDEADEEFPDLPPAGGPTSHMKPSVARARPDQAPVDARFARRKLQSNADRYDEPEPDPYDEGPVEPTSDEEREAHARAVLEQHRSRPARPSDDENDDRSSADDEDVDHELLARLATARLGGGGRGRGGIRRPMPARPVKAELDFNDDAEAMTQMKLEKEKADAVADVKARLLGSRFAEAPQKQDRAARLAYGKRSATTPAVRQALEADSVDDFLDSL